MKIGSFDTSSITNRVSSAIDTVEKKVEQKVDAAVDTVKEGVKDTYDGVKNTVSTVKDTAGVIKDKVVSLENRAENFARSEYEQAKDFAKVTGHRVADKVEQTLGEVKDVAFRIPQGVKNFGQKVFGTGDAPTPGVEGGADLKIKNSGKPDEVVDLNDKAKFLSSWGQKDQVDETTSDGARCQSNTMIAGLLMKGGPEEVKKGLSNALVKAKAERDAETEPNRKKALDLAVNNLQSAVDGIGSGKVTRGQLDKAADALFTVMTPAKEKLSDGSERTNFDKDGHPVGGISGVDKGAIQNMEKTIGLTDGAAPSVVKEKWFAPLTDDNREVSDKVWDTLKPGQSAHVGVNLFGENKATGKAPDGSDIKVTSKGQPYYVDKNGEWQFLNEKAQHAVLFGKNADGSRYIYNPIGDPPYVSETPGDKASSEKLDRMAANLMGLKPQKPGAKLDRDTNDWQAEVTPY